MPPAVNRIGCDVLAVASWTAKSATGDFFFPGAHVHHPAPVSVRCRGICSTLSVLSRRPEVWACARSREKAGGPRTEHGAVPAVRAPPPPCPRPPPPPICSSLHALCLWPHRACLASRVGARNAPSSPGRGAGRAAVRRLRFFLIMIGGPRHHLPCVKTLVAWGVQSVASGCECTAAPMRCRVFTRL